jgi:hypothetical protein
LQDKKPIPALVNVFDPLLCAETGNELESADLIRLFCALSGELEPTALLQRYRRITSAAMEPAILPALPTFTEKVVSPLVYAKAAFVAGNPLGTIALCGFVAEMIALVLYEMARDEDRAADLTMDEFESRWQQKRVTILHKLGLIDQQVKLAFDTIRKTRSKYLHLISKDHSLVFEDAVEVYSSSIRILVDLVGQEFENGALVLKPSFARYLRKHGLL